MTLPPNDAALEEAAHWYALLRSGQPTQSEQQAWQHWLHSNPAHRIAWGYVEEISQHWATVRTLPDPLKTSTELSRATQTVQRRRRALLSLIALAGSGACLPLLYRHDLWSGTVRAYLADYRAPVGEQSEVILADGTRMWLKSGSACNATISDIESCITLVVGEIFIETAPHAGRRFIVDTAQARLQALGTRFNVRQGSERSLLSVYEGAVAIHTREGNTQTLHAGEQAYFARHMIAPVSAVSPTQEQWTQGILLAKHMPLAELVDELRAYHRGFISMDDELANLPVLGSFPLQDVERSLHMLSAALPLRIQERGPWWRHLKSTLPTPS